MLIYSPQNLVFAAILAAVWITFFFKRKNPRAKIGAVVATVCMMVAYAIPTIASAVGLHGAALEMTNILFANDGGIALCLIHFAIFCAVYGYFYIETDSTEKDSAAKESGSQ